MTRAQKKELGLLPIQVIRGIKELGDLGDMCPEELALTYILHVSQSDAYGVAWKRVRSDTYGIDIDELIRLITLIMELILKFAPLFLGPRSHV